MVALRKEFFSWLRFSLVSHTGKKPPISGAVLFRPAAVKVQQLFATLPFALWGSQAHVDSVHAEVRPVPAPLGGTKEKRFFFISLDQSLGTALESPSWRARGSG